MIQSIIRRRCPTTLVARCFHNVPRRPLVTATTLPLSTSSHIFSTINTTTTSEQKVFHFSTITYFNQQQQQQQQQNDSHPIIHNKNNSSIEEAEHQENNNNNNANSPPPPKSIKEQLLPLLMNMDQTTTTTTITEQKMDPYLSPSAQQLISRLRSTDDLVLKQIFSYFPQKQFDKALKAIENYVETVTIDSTLIHCLILCSDNDVQMETVVQLASKANIFITLDMYNDMLSMLSKTRFRDAMFSIYMELVQDEKRMNKDWIEHNHDEIKRREDQEEIVDAEEDADDEFDGISTSVFYDEEGKLRKLLKANADTLKLMMDTFGTDSVEMADIIYFDCIDLGVDIDRTLLEQLIDKSPRCRSEQLRMTNEQLSEEEMRELNERCPTLFPLLLKRLKPGNRSVLTSALSRANISI